MRRALAREPGPHPERGGASAARWALLAALCGALLPLCGLVRAADVAPNMILLDAALVGPDVVAVGERGTILRSADHAVTWQAAPSPTLTTLTALSFAEDGRHGWAVGHDALILATADGGHTWAKQWQGENISDSFLDVLALDARRVIVVGAYGLCLATADGGQTWSRKKILEEDYHLNRLTRGPAGALYLAGEHGTLLQSADDGKSWKKIASPYEGSFYGILPLAPRMLLAHGLRGRLYRSTDDGLNWTAVVNDGPGLLATAVKLKSGFILAAGQARTWLISRDYARNFQTWDVPLTTAVAKLLELPDGTILALGETGATVLPAPPP